MPIGIFESGMIYQSAFLKAEGEGKFCNLDTDKLIEDNAVRKFFTTDLVALLRKEKEKRRLRR